MGPRGLASVWRGARVAEALAVGLLGLMAGFFFAFAVDVAPAMERLDAASYIQTQQWINRVVRNLLFAAAYFGSALMPFVTAGWVLARGHRRRAAAWLAIGLLYFAAVFWVTRAVNVPINERLATWTPAAPPAEWQQARDDWNRSNRIRAVAALLCFAASIALLARPTQPAAQPQ